MSTRGIWGYIVGGEEKLTYNHCDSYPSALGEQILAHLKLSDPAVLRTSVEALRLVTEDEAPSEEDIKRLSTYSDTSVATGDPHEWYVLLRGAQGDPEATLKTGVMIDANDFALDSLFCEWGYVIDLDQGVFEVYRGFQETPHDKGRFSGRGQRNDGYSPIALIASWPLAGLPVDLVALEALEGEEG